jgi:uncharacterized protein (TIGR03435 family)
MRQLAFVSLFGAAFGAAALLAQVQPPTFEVASVKPSIGGVRGGCHGIDSRVDPDEGLIPLGRCVITDGRLSHLIAQAYQLNAMSLIKSLPDWVVLGDERFDIQAEAEHPEKTTENELLAMLRALLADRFQLKFHWENKDLPGFALVIAKNGPKLKATKSETSGMGLGPAGKPRPGDPVSITTRKYSMPMLAQLLTQVGPRPVKDETGLRGDYDFKLSWDETNGPSLFTALQEQLGLHLEPRKVPVSFFVIESAQRPKEN